MTSFISKYTLLLNHLNQSIKGYQQCANEIALTIFKDKFKLLENSRQNLLDKCMSLNLVPSDQMIPSQKTANYFNISKLIDDSDSNTILVEIKQGESALLNAYAEILQCGDVSPHIKFLLEKQFIVVQSELDFLNFRSGVPC